MTESTGTPSTRRRAPRTSAGTGPTSSARWRFSRPRAPRAAAVIDVGGGASTLVDDLVDRGYSNVTVLDLSGAALDAARARLGKRGDRVHWICADVTRLSCPAAPTTSGTTAPCSTFSAIPWRALATSKPFGDRSSRAATSSWPRSGRMAPRSAAVSRSFVSRRKRFMPSSVPTLRGSPTRPSCTRPRGAPSRSSSTVTAEFRTEESETALLSPGWPGSPVAAASQHGSTRLFHVESYYARHRQRRRQREVPNATKPVPLLTREATP